MIFGLNLPNYSSLGHRDAVTAIADRADELGYSSLWTSDHILLPATLPEPYGNLLESFTTLSYLAARTSRIRLATGILVLPQRDPLLGPARRKTACAVTPRPSRSKSGATPARASTNWSSNLPPRTWTTSSSR
jgi:hypothetical protein